MLFGHKTVAWFDLWSIEHIATLMWLITSLMQRCRDRGIQQRHSWYLATFLAIALGFCWEFIEEPIERGLLGERVAYWMHGIEHWGNRWVADTLICGIIAALLAWQCPWLVWVAKYFAVYWCLGHIILTPHSMYLQTAQAWEEPLTWMTVCFMMWFIVAIGVMFRKEFNTNYRNRPYRITLGLRSSEDLLREEELFP